MRKFLFITLVFTASSLFASHAATESKLEYQNRFRLMIDYAVRTNEYVRKHLGDKYLVSYAHEMAAKNSDSAEQMSPPKGYAELHPHFLLVLENIEMSFLFASQGKLKRYQHHQKIVRKELQLLETLANRANLALYLWDKF